MALDEFQDAGIENEESAIDEPALGLRLLLERGRERPFDHDAPESRRRAHAGHRRLATTLPMKRNFRGDIDIRQSIAVGHAKRLARIQVLTHLEQAATRHGLLTGVHERHFPGLAAAIVILHPVRRHVERDVGLMQKIIREIFLHHVALVAQAHDELRDAERRIRLHDVPENRTGTDLHHGFRPSVRLLGDTCATATGQDHAFHGSS